MLVGVLVSVLVLIVAFAIVVLLLSGASLSTDASALAKVSVQPFGGDLVSVHAFGANGRAVPISVDDGRLTPKSTLTPGETVHVDAVVRRPGWNSWALGSTKVEHLTVRAPIAHVSERWLTVPASAEPRVRFDTPVAAVGYGNKAKLPRQVLRASSGTVTLSGRKPIGSILVAAAPRTWERLGTPTRVSWFPASNKPILLASPASGGAITPSGPIRLTFSKPVSAVLGSARPAFSPKTPGRWHETDSHTLVFTPAGYGAALASKLTMRLPHALKVAGATGGGGSTGSAGVGSSASGTGAGGSSSSLGTGSSGAGGASSGASSSAGLKTTSSLEWTVPGGSTLRLQQLLAQAGYLPLTWSPSGKEVPHTARAEVAAAVNPPAGKFSWRYGDTPAALQELWSEGDANVLVKGAVMKFENEHEMTVDGLAGRAVWRALMSAAIAGKRYSGGYTYVYVHREIPETLTLWHNGKDILTSAANTGIGGAETELGSYPVFEHIPEGTMEGTNPDGSHYHDEGIKWISYFNGGDAIHNFDRASFGTPQSLGCVELPLQASAEVWPYTPIGTVVTIAG